MRISSLIAVIWLAATEAGVIFVVFVPMGYIDATASLGIASR